MATRAAPTGSLEEALVRAERLMDVDPGLALAQAEEVLAVTVHPQAVLLRGRALRALGRAAQAETVLRDLAASEPRSAATAFELGSALLDGGEVAGAISELRRSVALKPASIEGWVALADALRLAGDDAAADQAQLETVRASTKDPILLRAAAALQDNDLPVAETLLRDHLGRQPANVAALRMLAEVAGRLGRYADAEKLLARALELAPDFAAARQAYAMVLQRSHRPADALAQIDMLLAKDVRHGGARMVKAAILIRLGDYDAAIRLYEALLADYPGLARNWMSYGHALKTVGRQADAVSAYARATALEPTLGEAWWSLANLKTYRFDEHAAAAMETALDGATLSDDDKLHLHFALGKAREDALADDAAFAHYAAANAVRRTQLDYNPDRIHRQIMRTIATIDRALLERQAGQGCPNADPIFIVGLPRAGSTLVEQILASHPLVEGTMELPDLMTIAHELSGGDDLYPDLLGEMPADAFRGIGEDYLRRTRVQRKTARPYFIDKMPNNWLHTGLIALTMPNAKIIDARRHPMDCCFSAYRQHFARGQGFSYGLEDLGNYYRDYLALMAHFDRVAPQRVHRVVHERLIDDFEGEVRALLDHCGLPFDAACLAFWQTERAVRTASSEQVRRPVNRDGVGRWRRFEEQLAPLKVALGTALDDWNRACED